MSKTPTRVAKTLMGAVALFLVTMVAAPPSFAAPTLNVSQLDGLSDGQTLTVSGSGFEPNMTEIAVGQCVTGYAGPADCNLAGGAVFRNADGSGSIGEFTIVVKEKFNTFDCTQVQCVVAAAPLPTVVDEATYKANEVIHNISFGDAATTEPEAPETTAPAAPAENTTAGSASELPKTGPGDEIAMSLTLGTVLFLGGGAALWMVSRRRDEVA